MSTTATTETFVFNGVDGATGTYVTPPLTREELSRLVQGKPLVADAAPPGPVQVDEQERRHLNELAWRHRRATEATFAPMEGVDPKDLAQSGWGVVFAHDANPALREALAPLLVRRRAQAAASSERRYRELTGADGVRPNDTKSDFLARHGAGPGPVDPDKLPYYLLLVGSPEAIPYRFQYHLDVQHAVGRIHFVKADGSDDLDAYAAYATSVVAAESSPPPRKAVFVAVQNPDDRATTLSATELVQPLAVEIATDQPGWQIETRQGDAAQKAGVLRALGGDDTPALLFTASHGMGFPASDPRQLPHQGALLCGDWPGPTQHRGEIPQDYYVAGDDIAGDARLGGLIAFHFACYGAGTPRMDDFAHRAFTQPQVIAPHPFVAALPQRLLGHPNGGALAVIGHVERAWGYSFVWRETGRQLAVFSSTMKRLMEGHPVGSAVEYFNEKYAELATSLTSELEEIKFGKIPDDYALAEMWTAHNDARSYAIVGDPAVRLG